MFKTTALVLTLIAVTSASVAPQQPDGAGSAGPPQQVPLLRLSGDHLGEAPALYRKFDLIRRPAIQKELNYTKDQMNKFEKEQRLLEELTDLLRRKREQGKQMPRGSQEWAALAEEAQAVQLLWFDRQDAALRKVLDRRQMARLDQIQLQAQGQMAFLRADIQEKLNMDPDQIEIIRQLVEGGEERMKTASLVPREMLLGAGGASAALKSQDKEVKSVVENSRQKVINARNSTMQAIAKTLTKRQRAKYLEMLGEPFDFTKKGDATSSTEAKPESEAKPK
jgi:hypothetical protein